MTTPPRADRRACLLAIGAAVLGSPAGARAQRSQDQPLPRVDDLRALAASVMHHKAPLLILFSTPGCPYCREVRRNYLMPRLAAQAPDKPLELLLHEVDITSPRLIVGVTGATTSETAFAKSFDVQVVPVVVLLDQTLRLLAEPLVGLDRSGFYEGYLAALIDSARKRLRQTS